MSRAFPPIFSIRIPAPVFTGTSLCGHKFTQIDTGFIFATENAEEEVKYEIRSTKSETNSNLLRRAQHGE